MKDWEGSAVKLSEIESYTTALPNGVDNEESQINKYHGFYVARYEAGNKDAVNETDTNQKKNATNNKKERPVSKNGVKVWNFIDWNHANESAKLMYTDNGVRSGLITDTQWDCICTWLSNSGLKVSGTGVKYADYYNLYYKGNGWYFVNEGEGKITAWANGDFDTRTDAVAYLTGCGLNGGDYHKSIADFTGSLAEWSATHGEDNYDHHYRGLGILGNQCSNRHKNAGYYCYWGVGFRVTLYLT